ncbi:acyl-CoA-like ligand-binding transcription factor [Nocardia stercoris]|nr:TetR family transcriptional regulator [Nocardia stercoris]
MSADSNPVAQARPGSDPGAGLRERKKERTRHTIRTEAFRLFHEQGYAETTVEQIAAAADISPSTFFRYFPSKEMVVLADDLDPLVIRSLRSQPAELSPLEAFRAATAEVFGGLDAAEYQFERDRVELVYTVPELRGVVAQELQRNIDLIAELTAERTGAPADSMPVRAFAGALTGAIMAVFEDGVFDQERLTEVLDFLQAGMPLPSRGGE